MDEVVEVISDVKDLEINEEVELSEDVFKDDGKMDKNKKVKVRNVDEEIVFKDDDRKVDLEDRVIKVIKNDIQDNYYLVEIISNVSMVIVGMDCKNIEKVNTIIVKEED